MVLAGCGDIVKATVDAPPTTDACTAATEATDCGEHQVCDESGDTPTCKCAAAYTEQTDGACTFAGAPADPGFMDPTKWMPVGTGPMVDAAAPGSVQPGELVLDHTALCNFSSMKQTFTMPPFDRADPLKVTITTTVDDPTFNLNAVPLQIAVGGQFVETTAVRGLYKTQSFCLGPAAFGGPIDISIGSPQLGFCAPNAQGSARVDELKIELAEPGECPRKSGVVNGSFQLSTGWNFTTSQSATGQILNNIGENNSFAAQLQQPNRCSEITANGTILVPSEKEIGHPALDIYWNGSSGARLIASIGGKPFGTLNANGQVKHSRLCLPKWSMGNINTISFLAQRVSNNNCTALGRSFILDNLTVVDEPACGTPQDITDPSFERIANMNGPMPGWGLINAYVNDVEGGRAVVVNQSSNAKSGVGVLQAINTNECISVGEAGAELAVIVPPASGSQGPAIKFAAKADAANVESETRAILQAVGAFTTVTENNAYANYALCIPPALAGKLVSFRLSTGRTGGGSCGVNYGEVGFFDDIPVGTDPTCPAQ
jgi:hypothetical protein